VRIGTKYFTVSSSSARSFHSGIGAGIDYQLERH